MPATEIAAAQVQHAPARDFEGFKGQAYYAIQGALFEIVIIRLPVDDDEVGPDVAVAVIAPFAGQWMIETSAR